MSRPRLVILGVKMTRLSSESEDGFRHIRAGGEKKSWYRGWGDSSRNLELQGQGEGKDPNAICFVVG